MTTNKATKLAATLTMGLNDVELDAAIRGLNIADITDADVSSVINAYRQRKADDVSDLLGDAPKAKAAKKVAKKAAKKKKKKKTAPAKKAKGPSRMSRMFELIIAGVDNATALKTILKEFAAAIKADGKVTTIASLSWTRSQLQANTDYAKKYNVKGKKILTNAQALAKLAK